MKLTNEQIEKILEEIEKTEFGVCSAIFGVIKSEYHYTLTGLLTDLYRHDFYNSYCGIFFLGPIGENKELRATAFLLMVEYFNLRGEE